MALRTIDGGEMARQLLALGVQTGGVLVVHAAFSKVGPVESGPRGLIGALLKALGPAGTLVMPSMTDDDEHPFDPTVTPCAGMGGGSGYFLEDAGRHAQRLPACIRRGWPKSRGNHGGAPSRCTAWFGQPDWPYRLYPCARRADTVARRWPRCGHDYSSRREHGRCALPAAQAPDGPQRWATDATTARSTTVASTSICLTSGWSRA